jgi:iron(III) transport system substrate-binding protein
MKKICSILVAIAMLASCVVLMTGCNDESAFGGATSTGGTITVYTALEDDNVTEYLESFNALYPDITVNIVRNSTGVITSQLIAEANNPVADLVWGTAASSLLILEEMGMLEPYTPAGVGKILPQFKSDKAVPTWVGNNAWETVFVVNTVEIEKLGLSASDIKGYQDLLRPELEGHVVMPNPASSGTGLLTVTALLQLNNRETEAGWDYLSALHKNIKHYTHSGGAPAVLAGSGECVVGLSFGFRAIRVKNDGAPVEIIFPEEGSGWDLEANALIKKDNINPAAKTFLDWAISDDAMALYSKYYPIITNGNVSTYDGFPDMDPVEQLIENDLAWIAANRENILDKWTGLFDGKTEVR